MNDRRLEERHRTYKRGRINADRLTGKDCIIRNLSDTGASLEIDSRLVPVDEFDLIILPEYLKRKCHVVWRKAQGIGVRFVV